MKANPPSYEECKLLKLGLKNKNLSDEEIIDVIKKSYEENGIDIGDAEIIILNRTKIDDV